MRLLAIVVFGAAAIGVTELPIDEFLKMGVAGGCLALVFLMVAKTIPGMLETFGQNLNNLTNAFRQSVADAREQYAESLTELRQSQQAFADRLSAHLEEVKQEIHEARKDEAALLRELVKEVKVKE